MQRRRAPQAPWSDLTRDAGTFREQAWEPSHGETSWLRRSAAARRAGAAVARRPHDPARRGDGRGDRPRIRPRRAVAPARPSVLVPVVRRGDGDGLALVGDHDQRHRRAEARPRAAQRRTWPARLRRPRQAFAQDAGRTDGDRRAGRLRRRGAGARQPPGRQGRQRRGAGRLRSLSAWLHRRRRRPLGGGAAGDEWRGASQARRYHWLSEGLRSFVDAPHAAIEGEAQGEIVNLADHRAETSRARQVEMLADLAPEAIARGVRSARRAAAGRAASPSSLSCRISSCRRITTCAPRTSFRAACRRARRRDGGGPARFRASADGSRRRRAHRAGAGAGRRSAARRAVPLHRSGASFVRPRRQGSPSVPGADQGLRPDDRRAEVGGRQGQARPRRRTRRAEAPRRPGAVAGAQRGGIVGRDADRRGARALARATGAAACSAGRRRRRAPPPAPRPTGDRRRLLLRSTSRPRSRSAAR